MAFITTKEMFANAIDSDYAIGAFNVNNMEIIQGIAWAAAEKNSQIILQASESAIAYARLPYLIKMIEAAMDDTGINICLHLDHGATFEICKDCINAGFTSVMIDGSSFPLEENIALTKKVVDYAHSKGVVVEAELGKLAGIEDDVNVSAKDASFTNPEEAVYFVEKTNVDSLAIAIGTSHGAFKFNGTPNLDIDRLKKIHAAIPNTPLVLHGASSIPSELVDKCNRYGATLPGAQGIPANIIRETTRHGICKVNVDTDIRMAMTAEIREYLSTHPEGFDPRKYLSLSREAIKRIVAQKIDQVLGSANSITTESL